MNLRSKFLLFLFLLLAVNAFCQTQKDTIYAIKSEVPVVIDGSNADACWAKLDWRPINQVWIPYGAKMAAGDFEGKYKVAWDSDYLYVLVEVIDDMISDDHVDPLQNWWDDDCVEVFLDENRSKGNHLKNNNAFAYHISTKYDAIDMDANGNGVNYKKNIIVKMDTTGVHTYLWEIAIKVYSDKFSIANPEASRVKLTSKKLMGFTIAYCDNDQTTARENFIGSMSMTAATANDNYITADYFGSLLLVDQLGTTYSNSTKKTSEKLFTASPNPVSDQLRIETYANIGIQKRLEIRSATGTLVKSVKFENNNQQLEISDLVPGLYFLTVSTEKSFQTERFIKQ
jgi:hypothetical protein